MNNLVTTFEKTFRVQNTWARSSLTGVFAELAEEAYDHYLLFVEKKKKLGPEPDEGDPAKWVKMDRRLTKLGIKSIVFTAMALEAGVFELAEINLDKKSTQALDRLNLEGKWLIVPQMICGRSLTEAPTLNQLHNLNMARNALVHHKSEPLVGYQPKPDYEGDLDAESAEWTSESIDAVDAAFKKMNEESLIFHRDVEASFKTLVRISLELESLIGNTGPLPQFSGKSSSGRKRSLLLKKAIGDCKASFKKQPKQAKRQKRHEKA